jgi:hypothetical protein
MKKTISLRLNLMCAFVLAQLTLPAFASPLFFSNRAAFESAIASGVLSFQSFESTFTQSETVRFGDVSVTLAGRSSVVRPGDTAATFGAWTIDVDPTVIFTFDQPINAFGIDIIDFGTDFDPVQLLFNGFGLTDYVVATSDGANSRWQPFFFGVIDPAASWIEASLTNTDLGDSMYYDGLAYGDVTAIPEPETYAMMLAGLALVGAAVRLRRG